MGPFQIRKAFLALSLVLILSLLGSAESSGGSGAVVLSEAARYFGADVSWKPAEGKLVLLHGNSTAQVLIGSDRLLINDYLLILSSPIRVRDGAVYVSAADTAGILSRLTGRQITEMDIHSAGLVIDPDAATGQRVLVDGLRYVSYPDFTRFIISLKGVPDVGKVDVQYLEAEKAFSIVFANSRFVRREPPVEVNDGVIGRVDFVQDGTQAKLVAKIHADKIVPEIQKFNDPPRVVLDIRAKQAPLGATFGRKEALPQSDGWSETETLSRRQKFVLTTVVIDPGHGGKDMGAHGAGGLKEKDVTLDIALRLKELIEKKAEMKVVLTRNNDYFVSLEERTIIANSAKEGAPADLFISIHTNSHTSPSVDGFEAFYISDAIDPGAEATAALENAVIALEKEEKNSADSSLAPILWDLQFTAFITESSELAFIAQEKLGERLSTRNRGVRQAKFIVLSAVAMPSVLIEIAFISNRVEEGKMKSADFKGKCAAAIADAVFNFKERHDVRLGLLDGKSKP